VAAVSAVTVVDSRGRPCPLPVIDLAKAIETVEVGQGVRVLSDDPGADVDIPAWCRMRGQELREVTDEDGHRAYLVMRVR